MTYRLLPEDLLAETVRVLDIFGPARHLLPRLQSLPIHEGDGVPEVTPAEVKQAWEAWCAMHPFSYKNYRPSFEDGYRFARTHSPRPESRKKVESEREDDWLIERGAIPAYAAPHRRKEAGSAQSIITEHVFPPIPDRRWDWQARRESYEGGDPLGRGATEAAAIEDLWMEEREEDASSPPSMKMLIDNDWLRAAISEAPNSDFEARSPNPIQDKPCGTCGGATWSQLKDGPKDEDYCEECGGLKGTGGAPSPATEGLCEDEGCPHHGTPHVCLNKHSSPVSAERKTFALPPGHVAVRDAEGRATGETRPAAPSPGGADAG